MSEDQSATQPHCFPLNSLANAAFSIWHDISIVRWAVWHAVASWRAVGLGRPRGRQARAALSSGIEHGHHRLLPARGEDAWYLIR